VHRRDEDKAWRWSATRDGAFGFAVWVLMDDGLRVPPFVAHSDGHGRLRAAGLSIDNWRGWVTEIAARHVLLETAVLAGSSLSSEDLDARRSAAMESDPDRRRILRSNLRAMSQELETDLGASRDTAVRRASDVIGAWVGSDAVRAELVVAHDAWRSRDRPDSPRQGVRGDPLVHRALGLGSTAEAMFQELYAEFASAKPRPPRLDLHVVDYPVLVCEVLQPVTIVLGRPPNGTADSVQVLREGFLRLASAS